MILRIHHRSGVDSFASVTPHPINIKKGDKSTTRRVPAEPVHPKARIITQGEAAIVKVRGSSVWNGRSVSKKTFHG
jgi:hypothetical protein